MSRIFACLLAVLLASCAAHRPDRLPAMTPGPEATALACAAVFPSGPWQFVHAIAFTLADGHGSDAIGIVVLDGDTVSTALTTVEGLTLFEARTRGDSPPDIGRALPPFDRGGFAAGLMDDVRALFLPPPGTAVCGRLADGSPVCRHTAADGAITDILPSLADGCWQVHTYTADGTRNRAIRARSCAPEQMPRNLTLDAPGPAGYSLSLRLLSAERLPAEK